MAKIDFSKTSHQIGAIATAIAGLGVVYGGLVAIGVDLPLTENSPVIGALHDTDKNYAGQFQIQELEVMRLDAATEKLNAEIKKINMESLRNAINSNRFILTQLDRPNLTPGDIREKVRLRGEIERFQMELVEWSKK